MDALANAHGGAIGIALAAVACLACRVFAADAHEPTAPVELTVWHGDFVGTLGDKNIGIVGLQRIGDRVRGQYCYGRCDPERPAIALRGRLSGNTIELEESVPSASGGDMLTGRWRLQTQGSRWQGEWRSPDGKRRWPIALTESPPTGFADELRVLAEHPPGDDNDSCESQSPAVTAILVYRTVVHGKRCRPTPWALAGCSCRNWRT